jgi:histidine triad (HIT) family protein
MAITPQKATEIKKQLLEQVKNMPNADVEQMSGYINNLDEQGLEDFLKQNNIEITDSGGLAQAGEGGGGKAPAGSDKPIFESIISGELPSYKLAENAKAIAILELNPVSYGHSIILPKQKTTVEKLPKSALTLAQKIAKRIKKKLKPEDIKIETFSFQEYPAINVIPIYKDTPLKKEKAEETELKKVKNKLETKKRAPRKKTPSSSIQKPQSKPSENLPEVHFRVPDFS